MHSSWLDNTEIGEEGAYFHCTTYKKYVVICPIKCPIISCLVLYFFGPCPIFFCIPGRTTGYKIIPTSNHGCAKNINLNSGVPNVLKFLKFENCPEIVLKFDSVLKFQDTLQDLKKITK